MRALSAVAEEMAYVLNHAGVRFAVVQDQDMDTATRALEQLDLPVVFLSSAGGFLEVVAREPHVECFRVPDAVQRLQRDCARLRRAMAAHRVRDRYRP